MIKTRMLTLLLVLAGITGSCQKLHGKNSTAQIIESVLAASLSACSSYELAHNNEEKADILKALCSSLRIAHALTFQIAHKHTYAGLKVAMGLLAVYDAVALMQQYKQLIATHGRNFFRSLTDDESNEEDQATAKDTIPDDSTTEPVQTILTNTFSDNVHTVAHQIELAAGLVLATCSSNKASALRCEYLACLALVAARCFTIAEQQRGLLPHAVLVCIVLLMILDFSLPGSPFNTMAAERDREFNEYIDLHANLAGYLLQLDQMRDTVEQTLTTPLKPHQHGKLTTFAREINSNRTTIRNAICAHDLSLGEVQKVLTATEHFLNQKMAPVLNTHHRIA